MKIFLLKEEILSKQAIKDTDRLIVNMALDHERNILKFVEGEVTSLLIHLLFFLRAKHLPDVFGAQNLR